MHPVEEATIRAFIVPHRRPRWLWRLEPEHRDLDQLNHCVDLDPRYCLFLPSNADVLGLLRARGAPPECYIIASDPDIDGQVRKLKQALSDLKDADWGAIISCIPGQLVYYYDEHGDRHALLTREPSK